MNLQKKLDRIYMIIKFRKSGSLPCVGKNLIKRKALEAHTQKAMLHSLASKWYEEHKNLGKI